MMYKTGANRVRDRTKKWITKSYYFNENGVEIDKSKIKQYLKTGYIKHIYEHGSYNFIEYWYTCRPNGQTTLFSGANDN